MLESFQIHNFRLFQHLEVKKLGRVNLIVGKNNSGKSTFLEAVELYASIVLDIYQIFKNSYYVIQILHSPEPCEGSGLRRISRDPSLRSG